MTAQSSANSLFYKFLPYYRNKVRYLRPQFVMSIIFGVLSYPMVAALTIPLCSLAVKKNKMVEQLGTDAFTSIEYSQLSDKVDMLSALLVTALIIGCLCLVGMFIFTFVTTYRSFRYLHSKNTVDMDLSLPVSHNTRFFGDLAAVFTVNILPHLVSILLGVILIQFADLSVIGEENVPVITQIVIPAAFTGLMSCIMLIGICLLMLSFCGRPAEAMIYPIAVNFAIPIIHAMSITLIESGTYGAAADYGVIAGDIGMIFPITSSSPLGMLFMTIYSIAFSVDSYTMNMEALPIFRPEYGIPALLITIACLAGAYFLIKYRRAERVGMPYVYKGMNLIIPGIVILAIIIPISNVISSVSKYDDYGYSYTPNITALVIGTLIFTFIVYVIMELISGRSFRRFHISVLKWAGTIAASALICVVLGCSNGFGMAYYVPAPEKVYSVTLKYDKYNGSSLLAQNFFSFNADSDDTELLELVHELHSDIPKKKEDAAVGGEVSFSYTMKDGTTLTRCYFVSEAVIEDVSIRAINPDTWFDDQTNDIEYWLNKGYEEVSSVEYLDDNYAVSGKLSTAEFIDAIRSDFEQVDYDFITQQSRWKTTFVRFTFENQELVTYGSRYIDVYDWMTNTISLLNKHGIPISSPFVPEDTGSVFIMKYDSVISYSCDFMLAIADGMTQSEYMEENGYYGDPEVYNSFGKLDLSDQECLNMYEKLTAVGTSYRDNDIDSETYAFIFVSADNWQEYHDGDREAVFMHIPQEYNQMAEQLMDKYILYKSPTANDINEEKTFVDEYYY